jgi:hypothetical protein
MRLSPAQRAALTDARDLLLIAHRRLRDAQLEDAAKAIQGAGAKVRWTLDRDAAARANRRAS